MSPSSELMKQLARDVSLMPKEQALEAGRKKQSLYIGIPKESSFQEHRVPLTPDAVAVLVGRGHEVIVEKDVGVLGFVPLPPPTVLPAIPPTAPPAMVPTGLFVPSICTGRSASMVPMRTTCGTRASSRL